MPSSPDVSPDDFQQDLAWEADTRPEPIRDAQAGIEGVSLTPLIAHSDDRGALTELLTTRDAEIEPIVHVYHVNAGAGTQRGWVYHAKQHDRLAFVAGQFRVVLHDIRPDSPTYRATVRLDLGADRPTLLVIPPYVVHGVENRSNGDSYFINLPTLPYSPKSPDKYRYTGGLTDFPIGFD